MKEEIRTIKVPVLWMMYGEIELDIQVDENADEEEILDKVFNEFYDHYKDIPLPEGYYLEDSFELNIDEENADFLEFYNK